MWQFIAGFVIGMTSGSAIVGIIMAKAPDLILNAFEKIMELIK